jgi:pimeloyl-ACP methyl ester carboxylesterase
MPTTTVTSNDGTPIAYEMSGGGVAVIVVNTVAEDRAGLSGLAGLLAEHFTVYSYDRRGRGDSGDTQPYAPEREMEDLAAVIQAAGGRAALVSGSAGCLLCLDAATALGDCITRLYIAGELMPRYS